MRVFLFSILVASGAGIQLHTDGSPNHLGASSNSKVITIDIERNRFNGKYISKTSQLQEIISPLTKLYPHGDWEDVEPTLSSTYKRQGDLPGYPILDDKILNKVTMSGFFECDQPLVVPNLVSFHLQQAKFKLTTSLQGQGCFVFDKSHFSSLIGGKFDGKVSKVPAIAIIDAKYTQVWGGKIYRSEVLVKGGAFNEVAHLQLSPLESNGITTVNTRHAIIHDNDVSGGIHGIALTEGTAESVAYNNDCYNNEGNGILIEGAVTATFVTNNTCTENGVDGISITAEVASRGSDIHVNSNYLVANKRAGIAHGGNSQSKRVTVANNIAFGNEKGAWLPWHGVEECNDWKECKAFEAEKLTNYWTSNIHLGPEGKKEYAYRPKHYVSVVIFDPVDAVLPTTLPTAICSRTKDCCASLKQVRDTPAERIPSAVTHTIKNGKLTDGTHVGTKTSDIQNFIDNKMGCPARASLDKTTGCDSRMKYYTTVGWPKNRDHSILDASNLRYLELEGDYEADQPLLLPSMFVLKLNGKITHGPKLAENARNLHFAKSSSEAAFKYPGMISADTEKFVAIIGGHFDSTYADPTDAIKSTYKTAPWNKQVVGPLTTIKFWQSSFGMIRGVTATTGELSPSVLQLHQNANHIEVSHNKISTTGKKEPRAIWCLVGDHNLFHNNHWTDSPKHALDLDTHCSNSMAFNNLGENGRQEGIFVEEMATSNLVFNNIMRKNTNGITTYALWEGPAKFNKFINNIVYDNVKNGMADGGGGKEINGKYYQDHLFTEESVFIGNVGWNNGRGDFQYFHGVLKGGYWAHNVDANEPNVTFEQKHCILKSDFNRRSKNVETWIHDAVPISSKANFKQDPENAYALPKCRK